jgi:hypothetical protein
MLRKLIVFAITSGLAAKLFRKYTNQSRYGQGGSRLSRFR